MSKAPIREPVLPDLLKPGLTLVFCGTAAGHVSAAAGHYYAHPQNRFWRTLYATGLTPRLLQPSEYKKLLSLGIGLTDIAKYVSGKDDDLPPGSLGATAIEALALRIKKFKPKILAFTSLTGGRKFLGHNAGPGKQPDTFGPTKIWLLPSPSPRAMTKWDQKIWQALADEFHAEHGSGSCALAS